MAYGLGVDLGTTFVAAAVDRAGRAETVTLGDRSAAVPSVVLVRTDGTILTGDAADRRAATEPERVAREFKRRLGDPTPLVLGGAPHSAASLLAHQLRAVVDAVAETEGEHPARITLTHPANWGPYKRELFEQVPGLAGLEGTGMVTEPEAAAAYYASTERLAEGATVAVYDLGGGTFDATVLRKRADGFEILGTPEGVEGLGGIDFDEAVYAHVNQALGGAPSGADPADPRVAAALVRLRRECVLAKEALSADTETTVPVLLPSLQTEVRLTRDEFEEMVRGPVEATIRSVRRALRSAQVEPGDLDAVLLVGGSSRIPLVSRLVSSALDRPTAVDAHPKYSVALGAAAMSTATASVPMAMAATAPESTAAGAAERSADPATGNGHVPTSPVAAGVAAGTSPVVGLVAQGGGAPAADTSGTGAETDGAGVGAGAPPPPLRRQRSAVDEQPRRRPALRTIVLVVVGLLAAAGLAFGVRMLIPALTGATTPAAPTVERDSDTGPAQAPGGDGGAVRDDTGDGSGTGSTSGEGNSPSPGQGSETAPPTQQPTTEPDTGTTNPSNPGGTDTGGTPGGDTGGGSGGGSGSGAGGGGAGGSGAGGGGAGGAGPGSGGASPGS